ncbi:MAG TPA: ABC transporter ATP-binding protein [Burkholderiales bacterium]|nr:ABC transporter ATP-binding protein [Burkholderiales bacterium]
MLQIRDLDLFYGDAQALAGVSLEVAEGEIVAIVGANGAGKTSLIRAIAGIEASRSGQISYKGEEIQALPPHAICDLGIGQVAEGRQVFPGLTVEENLEMGAMLPRARAKARQTMDEVFAMFPRLIERRAQLAGTLSGGEQQMCAIGRALMSGPKLVLLDEPSMGLAPVIVAQVFDLVRKLSTEGYTVLIVEQNVRQVLKIADRAYLLEVGRIKASGAAQELLASDEIRKAYMGI